MKILIETPDDKASIVLAFLRSISYIKAKPLNYSKARLIDEISEAMENMQFDESFGKIFDYNIGDIVVWRGNNPAICRIKGKTHGDYKTSPDFYVINKEYDSLNPVNLRYANDGEIRLLGDADIFLKK